MKVRKKVRKKSKRRKTKRTWGNWECVSRCGRFISRSAREREKERVVSKPKVSVCQLLVKRWIFCSKCYLENNEKDISSQIMVGVPLLRNNFGRFCFQWTKMSIREKDSELSSIRAIVLFQLLLQLNKWFVRSRSKVTDWTPLCCNPPKNGFQLFRRLLKD